MSQITNRNAFHDSLLDIFSQSSVAYEGYPFCSTSLKIFNPKMFLTL